MASPLRGSLSEHTYPMSARVSVRWRARARTALGEGARSYSQPLPDEDESADASCGPLLLI